jgi:glycosyltransferase involved in cell wall biosynthesis
MSKLKIIVAGSYGVVFHRLSNPMRYFQQGIEIELCKKVSIKEPDCGVIMYNVRGVNQSPESLLKIKAKGARLWADIDDWIERPLWHMNRSEYEVQEAKLILEYLRIADVVTCSTPKLQHELKKQFNIESNVIHNAIDVQVEPKEKELSIGWVGGVNHHVDHKILTDVLQQAFKAKRKVGGVNDPNVEYWQHIKQIWSGDYKYHVELLPSRTIYEYMELYKEIDVCLLPSHNDLYTQCKSNLKLLECASSGVPIITNKTGIYKVKDWQGLRVESTREWRKGIDKMIKSSRMRTELAEGLKEYAKEFTMDKANQIRLEILKVL